MKAAILGGHRMMPGSQDYEEIRALATLLASRGYDIWSGGYAGAMEAASLGSREGGRLPKGVVLRGWTKETRNAFLPEENCVVVPDMHERIRRLVSDADLVVACQGSVGTLAEFYVAWTLKLLGLLKPEATIAIYGEQWPKHVELLKEFSQTSQNQIDTLCTWTSLDEVCSYLDNNVSQPSRRVWNDASSEWDKAITDESHFANRDEGYARFDRFLSRISANYLFGDHRSGLDLGCATGAATEAFLQGEVSSINWQIDGLDFAEDMLHKATQKNIFRKTFQVDVRELARLEEVHTHYDLVFSRGILLSRMDQDELPHVLGGVCGLLKDKGIFVFDFLTDIWYDDVPAKNKLRLPFGELRRLLSDAGLRIVSAEGLIKRTVLVAATVR